MPGTKCPTVRSAGTTRLRSALMPTLMTSRASMEFPSSLSRKGRGKNNWRHFLAAAARSTKVLPPFILCASGASLIWITTASASTPRFFTSACVMSRIIPAFCSSVRPAAMLTVISGIFGSPFALAGSRLRLSYETNSLSSFRARSFHSRPGMTGHEIWSRLNSLWRSSIPLHPVFIKNLADFLDQCRLRHLGLGLALFLQIFLAVLFELRQFSAEDQILEQNLRPCRIVLLVTALDDHARRVAPVGIFELVAHVLGIAEIKLGANVGVAQASDHLLIIGDAIAVEYRDHDRAEFRFDVELAEHRQRGLQPRHADGEPRRRHRLSAKPR